MTTTALVARTSAILFGSQAVARVSGLLLFMVLTRYLTVEEVGFFGNALSLVAFLVLTVDFGFDLVVTREAARGDGGRGAGLALRLKATVFAVAYPVLLVVAFLLSGRGPVLAVAAVLGAAVWHESSNRTIGAFYLAQGRAGYGFVSESASAVLRLVLVAALLAAGGRHLAVAWGYAAASAVTVAGLVTWAYRAGFRPAVRGAPGETRGLFRAAAAFAVYGLLFQIYFRIDVVLLGALRPGADVGQYVAAFRVIEALLATPAVLTGALYPVLSRLDGAGDRKAFARACAEATRWLAVIGFGLSLAVGTAALPVIRVIAGRGYEPAAWYLQLLLPAFVFICLSAVGLLALNAVRQQRWNVWVMLAGAALKVAWNALLIPRYGVPAACVGSVVTGAVIAALLVTVSRPWYPALDWCRACAGAAFAGVTAVVAALVVSGAPVGVRFGVSLLVFVGVALAVRALRADDLATIRGLWRPGDSAPLESSR